MERTQSITQQEVLLTFARSMAEAVDQLIRSLSAHAALPERTSDAGISDPVAELPRPFPADPMSLREIKAELKLSNDQVVKLRRLWGFPAPCHRRGRLFFSRGEVARWAGKQPNPANLAAVLRLRRRRPTA